MTKHQWMIDGESEGISGKTKLTWEDNTYFKLEQNGRIFHGEILEENLESNKLRVKINHREFDINKVGPLDSLIKEMGLDKVKVRKLQQLKSPMPGRVVSIAVQIGDEIEVGAELLTLEAMKMENNLKSEGIGKVKSIEIKAGDVVDKDAVLITFE